MKRIPVLFLGLTLLGGAIYALNTLGCGGNVEENPPPPADMTAVLSAYSCDQRTAVPATCREFSNYTTPNTSEYSALCSSTLTQGPCPRTDSYGGCRASNANYTLTDWYYPPGVTGRASNAEIQTYCGNAYVPPN